MTFQKVVWSSKSYNWNTPDEVFSELDREFHFTFDPTDHPLVGPGLSNGLVENWTGRVFINPPYGRKLTKRWIFKGWQELYFSRVEFIVFLLPDRMGTDWAGFLISKNAEFRANRGRLKFNDGDSGAPFDSIVAILRK